MTKEKMWKKVIGEMMYIYGARLKILHNNENHILTLKSWWKMTGIDDRNYRDLTYNDILTIYNNTLNILTKPIN